MAFESKYSPWNPGYAIPKYVLNEPAGRGTFTTAQRRRGSIDVLSKVHNNAGFAIPAYIQKEVPGMGVFTTEWLPRGTSDPAPADSLYPGSSLSGSSLGNDAFDGISAGNPLQQYGKEGAAVIVKALASVPAKDQGELLKAILKTIDPALPAAVEKRRKTMPLEAAIASAMSEGISKEMIKLGKGKSPSGAKQLALAGLAAQGYTPTSGILDSLKSAGSKVYNAGKTAVNKVGSLACKVANNPITPAAAAGASAAYGQPPQVGASGAMVAQQLCSKGGTVQQAARPAMPAWVLPAAVGGGVLLLVLAVRR